MARSIASQGPSGRFPGRALNRRINHKLQRRIIVGLKARILELQQTPLGMMQRFSSRRGAGHLMRLPLPHEFGAALPQAIQQLGERGIAGPDVAGRAKLRHHALGLVGPTRAKQFSRTLVGQHAKLQRHFRHGSFAEQMMVPTENVKRLGLIDEAEAAQWCALGTLLVPYGGFLAANLDHRGSPENACRSADSRSSAACDSGPFWTAASASSNCCGVAMPTRMVPIAG
jgi:hypothetical protein